MAEVSVLPSTTRKFFCESGAAVTCCGEWSTRDVPEAFKTKTYADSR